MTKLLTSVLLAAGILSGCTLAPRYERPAAPVASAFPDAPAGYIATTSGQETRRAMDIGWREFFRDARLQALIAAALENNRDLRTAALRIEEARALYNVQSADLLPTINGTAGYTRSRTPGSVSPFGVTTTTSQYQVGLSLASFELDFFGRVRSLNNAALAQYLATEEAQRAAHLSLVAEVAKAYLAERAYAEQLTLAQDTLKSRESSYDLAKKRFDVGASSALDLRQAETLVESARVSAATLTRQQAQANNALAVLVGKPLGELGTLPEPTALSSQAVLTDIPAGAPSDLLTQRPDIRQAEQQLLSANANIGAARAAFFPRITLTSSIGTASNELSGLFDGGTRAWTFAPSLVLPIFDWGRNMANLTLSEVRKDIAVANYEKTIQTSFREVADALVARGTFDAQVDSQQKVRDAQAERLKLADLRYRNGVASYLELLDAQRELFSADQALVQARQARLVNAIDLYKALGGGLSETGPLAAASAPAATPQ
ncbi:efflux transporter outer membrane subunit [Imbroritus primus]|uniref:Efflux transporter outer membrane subunit n=1 Tax=Imbroritus primus TaxID=3058603 RepID=A0ACD3SL70_9BURK|nr:efflux transporter outer membrane subunit [Burkholderiaceae bacterium PBA]